MPIIYGAALSPFVRKVMISLNIKNIRFDQVNILPRMPNDNEGFKLASPLGKIPAFEDDQVKLADSSVICEYIEEAYSGAPLMPTDAISRAKVRWLEEYADSAMAASIGGGLFFERIVRPMMQQKPDEASMFSAINELIPNNMDYLETQLEEGKTYFVGSQLSLADIAVYSQVINGAHVGFNIDAVRWHKVANFIEAMKLIPAVEQTLGIDRKVLTSMGIETQQ